MTINFIGGSFGRALLRGWYYNTPPATLTKPSRFPGRAGVAWTAWLVGAAFTQVNLMLMCFNLIPIPPLDASSVPALFQVDPIGACVRYTVNSVFNVLVPR